MTLLPNPWLALWERDLLVWFVTFFFYSFYPLQKHIRKLNRKKRWKTHLGYSFGAGKEHNVHLQIRSRSSSSSVVRLIASCNMFSDSTLSGEKYILLSSTNIECAHLFASSTRQTMCRRRRSLYTMLLHTMSVNNNCAVLLCLEWVFWAMAQCENAGWLGRSVDFNYVIWNTQKAVNRSTCKRRPTKKCAKFPSRSSHRANEYAFI